VHQNGLVHISALSNTFVKDPHSVVKAGDVVKGHGQVKTDDSPLRHTP
jgi:transcriptional accessory protein Tex/SPT6